MSDADDCIGELAELVELAADLLADARSLRDRVTELENDGMEIRAIVDAADQLYSTAAAVAHALAAVADDFNDWGERWVPR
jgi:DNA-binding HxlR family transcriptional regulator